MYFKSGSGPWYLSLWGTPCVNCGQPAERLAVLAIERVITHQLGGGPPCHLSNPPRPVTVDEPMIVEAPKQAA